MTYTQPPFLKKGDTIAIVASARKITKEEIDAAIVKFNEWGLDIVFGNNLFGEYLRFSGTDDQRASDLQQVLNNPKIKAIISARGGYGTLRIIDRLDFTAFKKNPKWIIGYSDITVLHSHMHALGFQSIHGTMPINFQENEESIESLRRLLFGEKITYNIPFHPLNRNGSASGVIAGGNLSLLYVLSGSVSELDTKGKILFIEDLDEYLYHIDRMMISLKRSGKLSGLKGLVVGGLTDMKDNEIPFGKNAEEIVWDAVKEYSYPVCFNFPAGHIARNLALRLGAEVKLDVSDKGTGVEFISH